MHTLVAPRSLQEMEAKKKQLTTLTQQLQTEQEACRKLEQGKAKVVAPPPRSPQQAQCRQPLIQEKYKRVCHMGRCSVSAEVASLKSNVPIADMQAEIQGLEAKVRCTDSDTGCA